MTKTNLPSYNLNWAETTIFWGAGATSSLKLPTTNEMGKIVHRLAATDDLLGKKIKKTEAFNGIEEELEAFLCLLGDDLNSDYGIFSEKEKVAYKKIFSALSPERQISQAVYWRTLYDWDALRRLILKIPLQNDDGAQFLLDLYNIIDGGIMNHRGVEVGGKVEKKIGEDKEEASLFVLEPRRLTGARSILNLLLQMMMACAYYKTEKGDPTLFDPYIKLADILAELMQREGRYRDSMAVHKNPDFYSSREFYLFSYAIVSMNFDPILLWLIFNAHKRKNDKAPRIGRYNQELKLFHDFSIFMGVRRVDGDSPAVWYPFNETVAQRVNGYQQRVTRIGKFYFPHGSTNFRECIHCGKLSMTLGNEWRDLSDSLFPSPPFKTELFQSKPRSKEEAEDQEQRNQYDAIQCPFCGHMTYSTDIPMVMQTSYKGNHPSFIEEIQRDLKVCLEKSRHIVLMGYSLPKDDLVWRSVLVAQRNDNKKFCSVIVGFKGPKKWINSRELASWVVKIKEEKKPQEYKAYGIPAIESAIAIFGEGRVRAYTGGVPNVWEGGMQDVIDMLYPVDAFPSGFPF